MGYGKLYQAEEPSDDEGAQQPGEGAAPKGAVVAAQ